MCDLICGIRRQQSYDMRHNVKAKQLYRHVSHVTNQPVWGPAEFEAQNKVPVDSCMSPPSS